MERGLLSPSVETSNDWRDLLATIATAFSTSDDLAIVKRYLEAEVVGLNCEIDTVTRVISETSEVFPVPHWRLKYVTLQFDDVMHTELVFLVTRRRRVTTLRSVAVEAIAQIVDDQRIHELELPVELLTDIAACCNNPWTEKGSLKAHDRKKTFPFLTLLKVYIRAMFRTSRLMNLL